MADIPIRITKSLRKRNIEILDYEEGILKCNSCGKCWVREKTLIDTGDKKSFVNLTFRVSWDGRLPSGWWKCPNGCNDIDI